MKPIFSFAAALALIAWNTPALAQTSIEGRLSNMERRIRHLERRIADQDLEIRKEGQKEPAPDSGPFLLPESLRRSGIPGRNPVRLPDDGRIMGDVSSSEKNGEALAGRAGSVGLGRLRRRPLSSRDRDHFSFPKTACLYWALTAFCLTARKAAGRE